MKSSVCVRKRCLDWKLCYICQTGSTKKRPLRHTDAGAKSLAENLLKYWEADKLPFNPCHEIPMNDGKPDFLAAFDQNNVLYHHDCTSVYRKVIKVDQTKVEQSTTAVVHELPKTRSSTVIMPFNSSHCIFCSVFDDHKNMRAAGTYHASERKVDSNHNQSLTDKWKDMAAALNNQAVLARLASGDLAANAIFYHRLCYVQFQTEYAKHIKTIPTSQAPPNDSVKDSALEEVAQYLKSYESEHPGTAYIALELEDIYLKHLKKHGVVRKSQITNFTNLLLKKVPSLEKTMHKHKLTVMFRETVDEVVHTYIDLPDEEKMMMMKICQRIRRDMFSHQNNFVDLVNGITQKDAVPASLLLFTTMLVDGSHEEGKEPSQESLTCSQVILYNALKQHSNDKTHYKDKQRETPVMMYNAFKIYHTVRSKTLINHLHAIGLCVPYLRLLDVTKQLYDGMVTSFSSDKTFIPSNLRKGIFTVLVKDNIDLNATSTFATSHYHGTSISILQFPTNDLKGTALPAVELTDSADKSLKLTVLPDEYTTPAKLKYGKLSKAIWAPLCCVIADDITAFPEVTKGIVEELKWLENTVQVDPETGTCQGWSKFHSSQNREVDTPKGINSIAPLLREKVATLEMQSHTMMLNQRTVQALNPGQTAVDWSDCPVYALTRELLFRDPTSFPNYVAFMGGLHMQQTLLVSFGQLISGCGIVSILQQNNFSTLGLSAVVNVNHIARATYGLQVLLSSLYTKLKDACSTCNYQGDPLTWLKNQALTSSMCQFLYLVLTLGLHILLYIRSIREGNFKLHVEVLRKVIPWFFIFDHYNYARWSTVHFFDLVTLEVLHPDLYKELLVNGSFSFNKSGNQFSRMSIDQVHEQNNAVIKGKGGVTDLLNRKSESGLIRWEFCGPEVARMTAEWEAEFSQSTTTENNEKIKRHHDDNKNFQKRFTKDVSVLVQAFDKNPFLLRDLVMIDDSSISVDVTIANKLNNLISLGEKQFKSFYFDRLIFQKVPISDPITLNKLNLWHSESVKYKKPEQKLMNKIRSAATSRKDQAKEVFSKELFDFPEGLSTNGVMYHSSKSDLLKKFDEFTINTLDLSLGNAVLIIDMAHLIHAKSFADLGTFGDFAESLYIQISTSGETFQRWDLVFDQYFENSLKSATRTLRGSGARFVFTDESELPNNMHEFFLKNSDNKNQLNQFLAKQMIKRHSGSQTLVVTFKDSVLITPECQSRMLYSSSIGNCQSEEADQRAIRHLRQCVLDSAGYRLVVLLTGDTDVLVLASANIADIITSIDEKQIVVQVTSTSSKRMFDIRSAVNNLGVNVCKALPWFHAATGCDMNSSVYGKGKGKAWDTWMNSEIKDDLTDVFQRLCRSPSEISQNDLFVLTRFFIEMFKKDMSERSIGEVRQKIFLSSANDDMRKLPPSGDALLLHLKRATYIAGFLWEEAKGDLQLPDPCDWGWCRNDKGSFSVKWKLGASSISLDEFTATCSCRTKSCKNCKCAKAGVPCISFCNCMRECTNI